ncbi:DNA cytosine methyltransferase, partial [Pseudomonas nicosulfuronedens]
ANKFDELRESDEVRATWKTDAEYARRLRQLASDPDDFGYPRHFAHDLLTSSLRTEHTALSQERFLATEPGKTEPVSRFRKLPLDGLCNTLRAGTDSARGAFTSPRPIHPTLPRVITVREAARLHSFPDWFRFHATKWHGFRQIGNSVPPLLGRAIACSIIKALGIKPQKPVETLKTGPIELLKFDMSKAARHFDVPHDTIAQRTRKSATAETLTELANA